MCTIATRPEVDRITALRWHVPARVLWTTACTCCSWYDQSRRVVATTDLRSSDSILHLVQGLAVGSSVDPEQENLLCLAYSHQEEALLSVAASGSLCLTYKDGSEDQVTVSCWPVCMPATLPVCLSQCRQSFRPRTARFRPVSLVSMNQATMETISDLSSRGDEQMLHRQQVLSKRSVLRSESIQRDWLLQSGAARRSCWRWQLAQAW